MHPVALKLVAENSLTLGRSIGTRARARALRERVSCKSYDPRQGVQHTADQLAADGLMEYFDNPTHRRAKLVRITPNGEKLRMLDR